MCCCSVAQLCPTLCDPLDCSIPGFPIHHHLWELAQTHVHWVMPSIQLALCCPRLLLPSIFPSIKVFSNESVLHIRWPWYWSFSFSISPSNKYSGLISLRIDWFDLLAVQGTLKCLLQYRSSKTSILSLSLWHATEDPGVAMGRRPVKKKKKKTSILQCSVLCSNSHIHMWPLEKTYLWLYRPLSVMFLLFNILLD